MDISADELIAAAGKKLRDDFDFIKKTNPHYAERGGEAEDILIKFLNDHLPKRYAATSGFVIDSSNDISKQVDVIVYDAINSPVFRKDERVMILPSDNVAVAIEVKTNLNKEELVDAAQKISRVKSLKKSPISNVDQQVTMTEVVVTKTTGIVFAYSSTTTLETLANNLADINKDIPFNEWIDEIIVLDKGLITYYVKSPMGKGVFGTISSISPDAKWPLPYYLSISIIPDCDKSINEFYAYIMHHLTFFRKRSSVDTTVITGKEGKPVKIMQSFQFNSKSEISFADREHYEGKFHFDKCFYIYRKESDEFIGNIAFLKWKDGGVVHYSGKIKPVILFNVFYDKYKIQPRKIFPSGANANDWCSIVLPMQTEEFEKISYGELKAVLEKSNLCISEECKIPGIPKDR